MLEAGDNPMAESSEEVQRKRLCLQETMHSTAVEFARLISSEMTNSLIVAVLLQEPAPEEGEPPEESPKKKKKKKNKKKQRDDAHAEFGMAFDSDEEEDSISGLPAADKKGKKEKKKKVKKVRNAALNPTKISDRALLCPGDGAGGRRQSHGGVGRGRAGGGRDARHQEEEEEKEEQKEAA